MGGLQRTICGLSLGLWALWQPLPAGAGAETLAEPLPIFATCAGRLSALMEFQWLVEDPAADRTRDQRDAMVSLLEAVTPAGAQGHAMSLRVEAKAAAAGLLHQARFGQDAAAAKRAQVRAERLVADCTSLMIS